LTYVALIVDAVAGELALRAGGVCVPKSDDMSCVERFLLPNTKIGAARLELGPRRFDLASLLLAMCASLRQSGTFQLHEMAVAMLLMHD
jgi:hypothetical protein